MNAPYAIATRCNSQDPPQEYAACPAYRTVDFSCTHDGSLCLSYERRLLKSGSSRDWQDHWRQRGGAAAPAVTTRILTYADKAAWEELGKHLEADDVFLSPEYLQANASLTGGVPECFVCTSGEETVMYPYLKRAIPGTKFYDITSPYGFGGLICRGSEALNANFDAAFRAYCREIGIVSEFVRFNPVLNMDHGFAMTGMQLRLHNHVVVVHAATGAEEPWRCGKDVAKKLRKATEAGIIVSRAGQIGCFDDFVRMYHAMIDDKHANGFYHFDANFFTSIGGMLGRNAELFAARLDGEFIGGLLVLHGKTCAYNFLSCSAERLRSSGVNDLLQYHAITWSLAVGKRIFVLGGGLEENDSIYRFKAKFSPHTLGYYVGTRIHLPEAYRRLTEEHAACGGAADPAWFPAYRASVRSEG